MSFALFALRLDKTLCRYVCLLRKILLPFRSEISIFFAGRIEGAKFEVEEQSPKTGTSFTRSYLRVPSEQYKLCYNYIIFII